MALKTSCTERRGALPEAGASIPVGPILFIMTGVLLLAGCQTGGEAEFTMDGFPDPCAIALVPHKGSEALDFDITQLQEEIREARRPASRLERLGWLFVAKARASNDSGYYSLAEQSARCLESKQPDVPAALLLQGHILHQLHRFSEAEALARRLIEVRRAPFDYGLLGDVLLEQGNLIEAAEAYQSMADLKPGLQSYSRAAHVRWLKGDLGGALDFMRMAARSTSPRDPEAAACVHARLALYELQDGSVENALVASDVALRSQNDHAAALLSRGRILLGTGKGAAAIEALSRVVDSAPMPENQWVLAEAFREVGREDEALALEADLVMKGAALDPRTVSLYLATRNQRTHLALELAERELQSRRDVFALDTHAWALKAAGRLQEAHLVMGRALVEGTEDARLFYHAGVIAGMVGEKEESCQRLGQASLINQMLLPSERKDVAERFAECSEGQTTTLWRK